MGVKYYTHFLLDERAAPAAQGLAEFRGVVEVAWTLPRGDMGAATRVLARNFDCAADDIKLLQWSPLH
ncbi:MAG TPA: hypothetical protein VLT59_01955 [Steroidobacteraceae bacterium]|nr:hypothetical protein [Steroidobacteraceae bacterium]